jgi:hypothetical protein
MYRVTLVNLSPDARFAEVSSGRIERLNVSAAELKQFLANYSVIDRVEAAAAEPEIRVQSDWASWLVSVGQKDLILYDALNREAPGHGVTAEDAMAEIDGTASAARVERLTAVPFAVAKTIEPLAPLPQSSRRRVRVLLGVAAGLIVCIVALRLLRDGDERLNGFQRLADADERAAALAGVYLAGTQPGQHGLVFAATGELRLWEFRAVEAPRVVHAKGVVGQIGTQLVIATDQLGGVITVRDPDALVYCGETYTRLR